MTKTMVLGLGVVLALQCWAGVRQVFRPERFVRDDENVRRVQEIDQAAWIWADTPAQWGVSCVGRGIRAEERFLMPDAFFRLRRDFVAKGKEPLRFDVSADERFILFLDGQEIARGPHRGMPERWFYQSYEVALEPGPHRLEAIVWQMGAHAPLAQLSWRGGFILKAEGAYHAQLTTGKAEWKVAPLRTTKMTGRGESRAWGVGSESRSEGTSFYDEEPAAEAWQPAVVVRVPGWNNVNGLRLPGWLLVPTAIPDQMHARRTPGAFKAARGDAFADAPFAADDAGHTAVADLNALLAHGKPFTVPAHTALRAIWDLGNYYCAYPELTTRGGKGAEMNWRWTESLLDARGRKGDRAAFAGKTVGKAFGDVFLADGRSHGHFTTPWWRCGRWCQLEIRTADEPLTLTALALAETRYPTAPEATFECDDPSIADIVRICTRGLQMCSHEMFFDCPYFEQQMYPGDSRVQFLATDALHADGRLMRQAITLLGEAQRPNGFIPMNFPSRMTQECGTYTLCWVDMFRDYQLWHGDEKWLRARVPGVRCALDGVLAHLTPEGLLGPMPGWSFTDYTIPWKNGLPPYGGKDRLSAIESLQLLYALRQAARLEADLGERHFAAHYAEAADALAVKIRERFWCDARGMIADTSDFTSFSEQAQSFAILADALTPDQRQAAFRGLVEATDLVPVTVYFSHYLFDAYFACGRSDLFFRRLDLWRRYVALNMSTLQESPERPERDPRSDCHAWGAHPLYHLQAHVAGVRPTASGFSSVQVAPQPGPLKFLRAGTPSPQGLIKTDLSFAGESVRGMVVLPGDLAGEFVWRGISTPLKPGVNTISR